MDETTELPIPEVVGIDHIVLRTKRLPELLDFYENKLGLKLERHLKKFGLYQLRAGFALIDILDRSAADPTEKSEDSSGGDPRYDHFCLAITDLSADELIAWLEAEEIPHGKIERRYGATGEGISVYAKDPDGRRVELKLVDED
jgi:catechol 2,3-dioxygenase-like lactoylglutathione lyase family enzyme